MKVPEWFAEQLRAEQDRTYRVRWSNARSCFVVEQKAGRGLSTPPRRLMKKLERMKEVPDMVEEILTRARDGYLLFLEIFPSGRAGCPKCGAEVKLKPRVWEYAVCPSCAKDFPAVWFNLDGAVLEHLRYIDMNRGGYERMEADQDRENDQIVKTAIKDTRASLSEAVWDDWRGLFQVPRVGYTGKERMTA